MPSIRDLVAAIRQRDGVEAAVILGRDGLLIDSQSVPGLDAEDLAARIPAIIGPADELGAAANRGPLTTAVLPIRTHRSRATSSVSFALGACPISRSVLRMRSSETMLRNGDCSSSTASP